MRVRAMMPRGGGEMKSWANEKVPTIPVPIWWLEYLADHVDEHNEFMLRESAREIRRQLKVFKKIKDRERRDHFFAMRRQP